MTIPDLKHELASLGIPDSWYSLGPLPDEDRMCILKSNDTWEIFFFERGQKKDVKEFSTEDAACNFMLVLMRTDLLRFRS